MEQKEHSNWKWSGLLALVLFTAIGLLLREVVPNTALVIIQPTAISSSLPPIPRSSLTPSPSPTHTLPSSPSPRPTPSLSPSSSPSLATTFHVTRVIDGDTIELSTGQIVRYIGIDAPELHDRDPKVTCFGNEAFQKNKALVENKDVVLEKDVSKTDRYGRLLRYVYLDQISINELLVNDGFARAKNYPPDSKFKSRLAELEQDAKNAKKGLWAKCN